MMPNWEQQFVDHGLLKVLASMEAALEGARETVGDMQLPVQEDYARLVHLTRRLRSYVESIDPLIAPLAQMTSSQNNLARAQQEVENFRSTMNAGHLTNANTHAENALINVAVAPALTTSEDIQAVQETAVSFRRSLGQHWRHVDEEAQRIQEQVQQLSTRIAELQAEAQSQKNRVDEAISRFESQYSQAEADRRREAQGFVGKLQEQITEAETRFLAGQEVRQEKFAASLKAHEEAVQARLQDLREQLERQRDEFTPEFDETIEYLDARKREAEAVVGAVAQTGMVGGYQKVANEEKFAMRVWQGITVAAMVGFVGLMLYIIPADGDALSWPTVVGRVMAALGLGALAAYAGREAAKHGEKERLNRQYELEIATIGPFLATIPKDDQDAIKKQLADRAFGRGASPLLVNDAAATTSGLLEIVRLAMTELLKKR